MGGIVQSIAACTSFPNFKGLYGMIRTRKSLLIRTRDHQDRASWNEFANIYQPVIQRYAERQGVPKHDAADIAQEVFLQWMRIQDRFELREEAGSFRMWLKTVTRHKVIDWYRRRKSSLQKSQWLSQAVQDHAEDAERTWEQEERRHRILGALDAARKSVCCKTWKCFEEHILKQRKASAVAADLGTSLNSVYVNCTRVLSRIRSLCRQKKGLVHAR